MCDTFYIPADKSATGWPILAKNSDREPNEMQWLMHFPRNTEGGKRVKATFISMLHPKLRHAIIISKPWHIWGAEMGINEYGLAIGNEAVFTRVPIARKNNGLTGMDMIRLALESCTTAAEARDKICGWVVSPGQDACGGYMDRNFFYHNSFIIADPSEAFVLETAGPHWAWKKLNGFYAISNRLALGTDYDQASAAVQGKDFAATYGAPFMSHMSKGRQRKTLCANQAARIIAERPFRIEDAFAVLRSHQEAEGFLPHKGGMENICLHANGLLTPSQTTGSMVMELRMEGRPQIWATGSSAPCLSVYKPLFFGEQFTPDDTQTKEAKAFITSYWIEWERWHRIALRHYPKARALWQQQLLPLELEWLAQWDRIKDEEAKVFSKACFSASLEQLDGIIDQLPQGRYPGLLYNWHWKRRDKSSHIFK